MPMVLIKYIIWLKSCSTTQVQALFPTDIYSSSRLHEREALPTSRYSKITRIRVMVDVRECIAAVIN